MIPYQQLLHALTDWRVKNGLPVGHTDYLGPPQQHSFRSLGATKAAAGGEVDLDHEFDSAMVHEQIVEYATDSGSGAIAIDEFVSEESIEQTTPESRSPELEVTTVNRSFPRGYDPD
jgi:hypothetical protein